MILFQKNSGILFSVPFCRACFSLVCLLCVTVFLFPVMASTDDREKQSSSSAERSDAGKSIPVYAKAKFSFEGRNNDEV